MHESAAWVERSFACAIQYTVRDNVISILFTFNNTE